MPRKKKYKRTYVEYAAQYGVDKSTVTRWAKKNAPLDDAEAMKGFRASLKGPGQKDEQKEFIFPKFTSAPEGDLQGGAAAALQRLEDAETASYQQFMWAMENGNPFAIKSAREGWIKISESLRRYDLMVDTARRDSGAMLARDEVERIVKVFVWFLRIAGRQLSIASAKKIAAMNKPATLAQFLEELVAEQILTAVAGLASTSEGRTEIPEWFIDAMMSDLDTFFAEAKQQLAARTKAVATAAKTVGRKKTK